MYEKLGIKVSRPEYVVDRVQGAEENTIFVPA
jgi:hypothetical protein